MKLFEIEPSDNHFTISSKKILEQPASAIGLSEKNIEDWLASHPKALFPNEEILVIGQSISGHSMADVLALDSYGRLIIVEVKRGITGRETIAQLLEYAAKLKDVGYETLDNIAQKYHSWQDSNLASTFSDFSENSEIDRDSIGKEHRIVIVASDSDERLKAIVEWLGDYGVPLRFVPFSIYADESGIPRYFKIEGITSSPELVKDEVEWSGHWFFNTNETNSPGAYARMFEYGVIAIHGYASGPKLLEGTTQGDKVLAYINGQGLSALGEVQDSSVRLGQGIFADNEGAASDEYHVSVKWTKILSKNNSIRNAKARELGYSLPVLSTFAKLLRGEKAQRLEDEILKRS